MKTNEELSEMAEEYANSIDFTQTKNLIMIIAKAFIKGYQAAQEEIKWIDCKDRLPDEGQFILLYGKGGRQFTAIYEKEEFLAYNPFNEWLDECEEVTHWQCLPTPPKTK